jgi:hypothetical protein
MIAKNTIVTVLPITIGLSFCCPLATNHPLLHMVRC